MCKRVKISRTNIKVSCVFFLFFIIISFDIKLKAKKLYLPCLDLIEYVQMMNFVNDRKDWTACWRTLKWCCFVRTAYFFFAISTISMTWGLLGLSCWCGHPSDEGLAFDLVPIRAFRCPRARFDSLIAVWSYEWKKSFYTV